MISRKQCSPLVLMMAVSLVFIQIGISMAGTIVGVPDHAQEEWYYCGPASLEDVFHFYGPDIDQYEIADAAQTDPNPDAYGTYTGHMRRAAHFSDLSTSTGNEIMPGDPSYPSGNITGYSARGLGYAAFEAGFRDIGRINALKPLIDAGYPIIVLQYEALPDKDWGHFRVVTGYNDTHIFVSDPNPNPEVYNYTHFEDLWDFSSNMWGLLACPWDVSLSAPVLVSQGDTFTVTATVTYPFPAPFSGSAYSSYPAASSQATIQLPAELDLALGETPTKTLGTGTMTAGSSQTVQWDVDALNAGSFEISVEAEGQVTGSVSSITVYDAPTPPRSPLYTYPAYTYTDRIGGTDSSSITVQGEVGWINGTVTDADTGLPIAGATVSTDAVFVLTDASGFYELEVGPGIYDVTAEMTDYIGQTALVTVVADTTTTQDFALSPEIVPEVPTIESCDSTGVQKDLFDLADTVYVNGSGYTPPIGLPDFAYDIYVVNDVTWTDGMAIPARVPSTVATVTPNALGNVQTAAWLAPLTPGKYDIVVDVNGNGVYDEGIDALDDNDIEVTAGFFVIPEFWIGTILGLAGCFAAFGLFRVFKRRPQ